jgi:NADH:ubiquinone oxidoreductase subunit K
MLNFVYDFFFYVFFQITLSVLWISLFTIATPLVVYVKTSVENKLPSKLAVQFGIPIKNENTEINKNELKSRENVMLVLLSLEMAIVSVCLLSVAYSIFVPTIFGHMSVLLLIILAGSESALGLAMLMIIYKMYNMISFDTLKVLKG